jgi:OOP family OmpA-OmpF porin
MRGRVGFSFPLAVAFALFAHPAYGGDCAGILSPCINDDALWPHAGPAHFAAVGSAETVAPGQIGFGLVASYLSRPIVLTIPSPGPPGSRADAIDDQVNGTFLWSYGVTKHLELDLALPVTFGQSGTGLAPLTGGAGLKTTALRDLRFGFAYAILSPPANASLLAATPDGLGLVGRLEVSAPTGDSDQFAGERSGVFAPSLAAEYRRGRLFAGVEFGARLRPKTELLGARVGTQLVASLGGGYDILPHELLSATLEAWALPDLAQQHDIEAEPSGGMLSVPNGKYITPAEWQLSARTAPIRDGDLSLQVGGGGGIPLSGDTAITTPRFRFTLSVRWAPRSRSPAPPSSPPLGASDSASDCAGIANGCPEKK